MTTKTITLDDFLSPKQIKEARKIYYTQSTPAKEICEKVIKPNILEINRKLGQENDPMYLAYVCEFVFSKVTVLKH